MKTRSTLLQSALKLMGEEKALGSLSLREVAAEAGIVPAAFYRHFKDMEELGLALVDEVSAKLRSILRDARKKGAYKTALKISIDMFFSYVKQNGLLFRFMVRERVGGNRRIRQAIRSELNFVASELASDMRIKRVPPSELAFVAEFIVFTSFGNVSEFLDSDPHDTKTENFIKAKTVKQIRTIFRGSVIKII